MFRTITASVAALFITFDAGASASLEHSAIIDAPVADVWRALTDPAEVVTWMTAHAEIDLRVGGLFRTNYNPNGAIGDESTIANRIIAFEPGRMLALQNAQAPAGFPWPELIAGTWSVMYLDPISPDRTRLRIVGMGYGEGEGWDRMREFFDQGNTWTIEQLQSKFKKTARDNTDPLDLLTRMVGGEWIHESETPDGGVFRVRSIVEFGADGKSLTARGWLGDSDGMHEHGSTIIYRDPTTGAVRFLNVNERGTVAQGAIHVESGPVVVWDWNAADAGTGEITRYRVENTFPDSAPDHHGFRLYAIGQDGARTPLVNISYTRVDRAPEVFLRHAGE